MSHLTTVSQVNSRRQITSYFDWHRQHQVPLLLLSICSDGPTPATLLQQGDDDLFLNMRCLGMSECSEGSNVGYALIGSTPGGANFLASGQIWSDLQVKEYFKLTFPQWLDVSQSRDCFRCPAPIGYVLHFSSVDPHLNDTVCRVSNVSLGGLAVTWDDAAGSPPCVGSVTDAGLLQAGGHQVHLGALRVAHITPQLRGCIVGLEFEKSMPTEFVPLVLDSQRTHYRLNKKK